MNDWTNASLRERENASIRAFVEAHAGKFAGEETLDFGCGRQPFRKLIEETGKYKPFDRLGFPGCTVDTSVGDDWPLMKHNHWGAILCTQVVQYTISPSALLRDFKYALKPGGWLVMTGPTNWPEVENDDLWRLTVTGIAGLMEAAGFTEIEVVSREALKVNDIVLSLGWGAVGTKS